MREFYGSDVQDRFILAVHPIKLCALADKKLVAEVSPVAHSAESGLVVVTLPRAGIKGWQEHLAGNTVCQFDLSLDPVKVAKRFWCEKLHFLHRLKGHPRIGILVDRFKHAHREVVIVAKITISLAVNSAFEGRPGFFNTVQYRPGLGRIAFANAIHCS